MSKPNSHRRKLLFAGRIGPSVRLLSLPLSTTRESSFCKSATLHQEFHVNSTLGFRQAIIEASIEDVRNKGRGKPFWKLQNLAVNKVISQPIDGEGDTTLPRLGLSNEKSSYTFANVNCSGSARNTRKGALNGFGMLGYSANSSIKAGEVTENKNNVFECFSQTRSETVRHVRYLGAALLQRMVSVEDAPVLSRSSPRSWSEG